MNLGRTINLAAKYSALLGGLTILASAGLVTLEVIIRNLGINIRLYSFELTNYAFACAVAFAFAYTTTERSHIRIDLIYRFLPVKMKVFLDIISMLFIFLLAFGMTYHAWRVVAHSASLNARPNTSLKIPLAFPQGVWAIGLTFFAIVSFGLLLRSFFKVFNRQHLEVNKEIGILNGQVDESPQ